MKLLYADENGNKIAGPRPLSASDFNPLDMLQVQDDGNGKKIFVGLAKQAVIDYLDPNVNWDATINVSYLELTTLISNNQLRAGFHYRIHDYKTVHEMYDGETIISGATHICETEVIIVKAISNRELSPIAYSEIYPQDIIF